MAPPSQQPLPPNEDRASILIGVYWGLFPLTVVTLSLRFYVRTYAKQLGLDDWFMLVAWVIYLGFLIASTIVDNNGGARHAPYLTPDQAVLVIKGTWAVQTLSIMTNAFAKTSIAFLLQRIMGPGALIRKGLLWATTIIFFILCVMACLVSWFQCNPVSANWALDPAVKAASCLKPSVAETFELVQGSWGAFQDFFLAIFPISVVWGLQLNIEKKVGLCLLLGLGVFSGISGIVKTISIPTLVTTQDVTWESFPLFLWASIESCLYIFLGCVPACKPVYDWVVKKKPLRPSKGYAGNSTDRSKRSKVTYNSNFSEATRSENRDKKLTAWSHSGGGQWEPLDAGSVELGRVK